MYQIRQFFFPYPIDTPELSIHAVGIREAVPPTVTHRPGSTGDWLFMFLYEPNFVDGYGEQPGNTLIVWDPEHGHCFGRQDIPWTHSWLHCDGSCLAPMLAECAIPLNEPLRISAPEMMDHYLVQIHREAAFFSSPDPRIARNILQNWIYEIGRDIHGRDEAPAVPPEYLAAKRHISEHFDEPTRLADLAEIAHVSVPHFCNLFKRYFNQSPISMLIEHRMRYAAYLLRDVSLSITEIAVMVGYRDLYQFSKLFSNRYHMSPRLMRERLMR